VYFQVNLRQDTGWVVTFILLTIVIGCLYDDMDLCKFKVPFITTILHKLMLTPRAASSHFQARIRVHGAVLFCFINSLPSLTIVILLIRELFREDKILFMPLVQLTIIISPMFLHFVATASMCLVPGDADVQGRRADQVDARVEVEEELA
jgi:hypothetical protein